ncbi:MAG: chorismate mutase [Evtepia gabavorous]
MNLEELRTEIDAIDDTLVNAFAQRMDVVARVSQAKKEQGLPTWTLPGNGPSWRTSPPSCPRSWRSTAMPCGPCSLRSAGAIRTP